MFQAFLAAGTYHLLGRFRVDDAESLRNMWPTLAEVPMHHGRHRTASLIAVADEAHVAGKLGNRKILSSHNAT